MVQVENSIDVIQPFLERFEGAPDIQVMGGLGSTALRHPELVIDIDNKELRVPDHDIPTLRPNGTIRDADVFVATEDVDRIREVKAELIASVAGKLVVSVCAYHPYKAYEREFTNPLNVTSDRYRVDPFRPKYGKVLAPFVAPIDPEALEQWQLIVNDAVSMPVSHPGATLANYTQRSIVGLRPKDKDKTNAAARNIFEKTPEVKEWLLDGPGRSQFALSHAFTSIRQQRKPTVEIVEGIELPTLSLDQLTNSPLMMAPDAIRAFRRQAVDFAALKARGAYAIESNPQIVKFFNQEWVEQLFRNFIKSR